MSVHVRRLSEGLSARGATVGAFDPTPGGEVPKEMPPSVACFTLRDLVGVARFLDRRTIVHLHSSGYGTFGREAILMRILRLRGGPVVWTIHGGGFATSVLRDPARRSFARAARSADRVVFVNEAQRAAAAGVLEASGTPASVIPAFIPPRAADRPRPADGVLRLLVMGKWEPLYGFETALDALRVLRDEGVAARLTLVGYAPGRTPEHEAHVRAAIAESALVGEVDVLGAQDDPAALYAAHDALLRPTTLDGDSVAVREALATGLAVFASDVAPRPEGCALHRAGDAKDLARGVAAWVVAGQHRRPLPTASAVDALVPLYLEVRASCA